MVTITKSAAGNICVHVDCKLKTGGTRQFFVNTAVKELPKQEASPFVQILARAFKWKEMIVSGTYSDKTKLAHRLGIDKSHLSRCLRLPYLSPVIVEKILNGDIPDGSVERFGKLQSPFWFEQHAHLGVE